jgi:transcriptional regulator with XRE-family HTH domain
MSENHIGQNVRKARQSKGLTIEQLAELAGISDSFLGGAERGTSGFSLATIIALSKALGVSTDSLLLGSTPEYKPSTKMDTLTTILSSCADNELDFLIQLVKLSKQNGIFKSGRT